MELEIDNILSKEINLCQEIWYFSNIDISSIKLNK